MKLKAVFLDKDGNLIPEIPEDRNIENADLNEQFIEGLQILQSYGYLLVVISNQSGVAYGYVTPEQLEQVNYGLLRMCSKMGIYLDGFYYCPHHPEGTIQGYSSPCGCRKPEPGLLLKAADDMDIDLSASWVIGDRDLEAGRRAGCHTILVKDSPTAALLDGSSGGAQHQAKDLADAARKIVEASGMLQKKRRSRKVAVATH